MLWPLMAYCLRPSHIWALRLYRKYSAMPCFMRRTRMVDASGAAASIGSSVAKIISPAAWSSFSSLSAS